MWFDSHSHLQLVDDPEAAHSRARAAAVEGIAVIGIDLETSLQAVELAARLELVATVGVHPNECEGWNDATAERVAELSHDDLVVGIGETGLDFYRDRVAPDVQRAAFQDHVALAKERNKALIIHTRSSVEATLEVLEKVGPPQRLVFHCWTGDASSLGRAVDLGAYISFAGNVTFRNAQDLRDRAAEVPSDRVLVETDSPYLAPDPHRGKDNEPAHVVLVGRCVAGVHGVSSEDLARVTSANARALFGLSR